jgi:hypothetical protein
MNESRENLTNLDAIVANRRLQEAIYESCKGKFSEEFSILLIYIYISLSK